MISFFETRRPFIYCVDPEKRIAGLMLITTDLSLRIPVYNLKSVRVGFVVGSVKLEHVVLLAIRVFPFSVIPRVHHALF